MEFLIKENGELRKIDTMYFEDVTMLKVLSNKIRVEILRYLSKEPKYPKALSRELGIQPQKLHYHFKKLEELNLIEKIDEKRISGSVARVFKATPKLIAINIFGDTLLKQSVSVPIGVPEPIGWTTHFVKDGMLNARIVVGSPDLHGPFSSRARDSWSAAELTLYLGRYIRHFQKNPIVLDTAVDNELIKENLILIGGPITNSITLRVNRYLPMYFDIEGGSSIVDKIEMKKYTDDNLGIIALIDNPFSQDEKHKILVCAGKKIAGTRAAILALTEYEEKFSKYENFSVLVEGVDRDSDGIIDDVTFIKELKI
ncbi:MAG: helix-turn-helix domain-containing protein [Candidatus Asgardarchaeia archaeon]